MKPVAAGITGGVDDFPDRVPVPPSGTNRRTLMILISVIVGIVALATIVGQVRGGDDEKSSSSSTTTSHSRYRPYTTPSPAPQPPTPATPARQPLTPADFSIEVIVVEQKCFGSAGCIYTYNLDPSYVGLAPAPDDGEFTIVFEILGGDEPQVRNIEVEDGRMKWDKTETIEGSQGAVLTARVTRVVETG